GNMRQRLFEQRRVLEAIFDALLELGGIAAAALRILAVASILGRFGFFYFLNRTRLRLCCRRRRRLGIRGVSRFRELGAPGFWASAHLRSVKRRPHRIAVGQRQTSQACASSPIEK